MGRAPGEGRGVTALGAEIAAMIRAEGPMPLSRYVALALGHPVHGYYRVREAIGRHGDFTTAPEISQMFGEIIGAWAVHVYGASCRPHPPVFAELGPGRGTLMADMLRVASRAPGLSAAPQVHLVETSPVLRARQRTALTAHSVTWHDRVEDLPAVPTILVANEFLDALPFDAYEARGGRFRQRMVGLSPDGRLALGLSPDPVRAGVVPHAFEGAAEGSVFERAPEREAAAAAVAAHVVRHGGAALFVDYGHARSGLGDTFQAVAGHAYADPFEAPGEADLTSHVDFEAIGRAARHAGAAVHGPIGQGAFLLRLGIAERAKRLAAGKDDAVAAGIAADLARLTGPDAMGTLFQVMCLTAPGAAVPPPFG